MTGFGDLAAEPFGEEWWQRALNPEDHQRQLVPVGAQLVPVPVERMTALMQAWAIGFAARRADVAGHVLKLGSRGLHPDECASFLRGLDAGQLHADSAGFVTPNAARPKPVGGRYALCCKSGPGVTVNTEYIIQLGAVGELVSWWGWRPEDLQVEMTEFDLVGFDPTDRVVLAVEAKARVTGPDSLEKLFRSLLVLSKSDPPEARGNAERKYLQLLRFCESGPVVLWLIAAGARWAVVVNRSDDRLILKPGTGVGRQDVLAIREVQ